MHSSISGISGKEVLDEHTLDSDLHAQASPQDDGFVTALAALPVSSKACG